MLATKGVVQKSATLGQGLIGRRRHLGQHDVGVFPGHNVARARDTHREAIVLALNLADRQDVEQFGMQRPAVELEYQVADARSQDVGVHDMAQATSRLQSPNSPSFADYNSGTRDHNPSWAKVGKMEQAGSADGAMREVGQKKKKGRTAWVLPGFALPSRRSRNSAARLQAFSNRFRTFASQQAPD